MMIYSQEYDHQEQNAIVGFKMNKFIKQFSDMKGALDCILRME
ncbi:unnamed protein product [Paramecium sonneborni]|uniref:Uncharacterized protein n=1 Tax=Paramecium sonneborni TaxID=65129 RepID=A0A8S1RM72_9CILI|nr:unnamed protein product [Paramecium sonneborni]